MKAGLPNEAGIYQILNTQNGNFYIGSAVNIRKRLSVHKSFLQKGSHHNPHLQSAWNKYGSEAFEVYVLFVCAPDNLLGHEQMFLDSLEPHYNVCKKAGSGYGVKLSEAVKAEISKRMKERIAADPEAHAALSARAREAITNESRIKIGAAIKKRHDARRASDEEYQRLSKIAEERGVTLKSLKVTMRKRGDDLSFTPRRRGELLTANGLSMTKSQWACYLGVSAGAITNRLKKFPIEEALSLPGNFRTKLDIL